ncbi:unnamed protein product [Chrysodeixis includens]|uniref:Uncharacterized protein n=1 Tax=Chrysodeixis includens TaxID=689277 RepID=A0A9P0FQZ4_CHRIL|nr:unnamed protein product [Chrysodeixis includens]
MLISCFTSLMANARYIAFYRKMLVIIIKRERPAATFLSLATTTCLTISFGEYNLWVVKNQEFGTKYGKENRAIKKSKYYFCFREGISGDVIFDGPSISTILSQWR